MFSHFLLVGKFFNAFFEALNVLQVYAKQIVAVKHLKLYLPLVKGLSNVRPAAVEAEVKPRLILNVVSWSLDLFESILPALQSNYCSSLHHQEVAKDSLTKERRHYSKEKLTLHGQLFQSYPILPLVVRSVRVAKLTKQRLYFSQENWAQFIIREVFITHVVRFTLARNLVVTYGLVHVVVKEVCCLQCVSPESSHHDGHVKVSANHRSWDKLPVIFPSNSIFYLYLPVTKVVVFLVLFHDFWPLLNRANLVTFQNLLEVVR